MRFVSLLMPAVVLMAGCSKKGSADLAFASPDDTVVAHVNVAALLDSKLGKGLAPLLALAQAQGGPDVVARAVGLPLDKIEAVTLAMAETDGRAARPRVVIRAKADFKPEDLFPGQPKQNTEFAGLKDGYTVGPHLVAVLDSKRYLVIPDSAGDAATLKFDFPKDGPLAPALEAIGRGKAHFVVGANPKNAKLGGGNDPASQFGTALIKNGRVPVFEMTAGDEVALLLSVFAKDSDDAADLEKTMKDALALVQTQAKMMLGQMAKAEPQAAAFAAPILKGLDGAKVDGSGKSRTLSASMALDSSVLVGLMLPAVQKVREAAARMQASNNLKQVMISLHNFHDTYGSLPGPNDTGKTRPAMSWRVAILPYIEQQNLFQMYDPAQAWDSPTNKKLLAMMPKTYMIPGTEASAKEGKTHLRAFSLGTGLKLTGITDGTSNTLGVVEAAEAVEWTKPDTLDAAAKDLHSLFRWGWNGGTAANVGMFDGSVRTIRNAVSPATLKAAVTPQGGEVLGSDW